MAASLKGVVLAAGLGTRLRPLTTVYPKPLVPVIGSTPLELALWRLGAAGIDENAVNSHHQAALIAAFVERNPLKQKLKLAYEPEILGTGGVYNPLRAWRGGSDLVVLNGDVISDLDLGALIAHHQQTGAVATMALLPQVIPGESAVYHAAGRVLGIGRGAPPPNAQAGNFACVQILTGAFLDLLPTTGVFDVISAGYNVALARGLPIAAYVHDGIWHDLRTPDFYWQALKDLMARPGALAATGIDACRAGRGLTTSRRGSVIHDSTCQLGAGVTLAKTVIVEPGCRIGPGAVLEDCLLLPGAVVGSGAVENRVILGLDLRVPIQAD